MIQSNKTKNQIFGSLIRTLQIWNAVVHSVVEMSETDKMVIFFFVPRTGNFLLEIEEKTYFLPLGT